jgi:ribosome recycling factor
MTPDEFKTGAQAIITKLKEELASIRANRPTPALVENIQVDYYNQKTPIQQLGSITTSPPREIQIHVWDKSAVEAVAKAIETSPLNLSASAEGGIIRIHLPELSQERRAELSKHVGKIAESYRIKLRTLRDEANKAIQKSSEPEDQQFKKKKEIQETTDKANKEIEEMLQRKIKEISE